MKNRNLKNVIIIVSVIFFLGLGTYAFAGQGFGKQRGGGWGQGCAGQMGNSLSAEDQTKVVELRDAFRNETEGLRKDLYGKNQELRTILTSESVDTEKAMELQKEISALRAELDQKRLNHRIEMQKLFPEGTGSCAGYGKGRGRMGGHGMGKRCYGGSNGTNL